jgi:two-component system, OmpR family, sensor histidine kinase BaeS
MKLQAKFVISFISLVVVVVTMSFMFINFNTRSDFEKFIEEKRVEEMATLERNVKIKDPGTPPEERLRLQQEQKRIDQQKQREEEQLRSQQASLQGQGPAQRKANRVTINPDSPEFRFLDSTKNSLFTVGLIGIFLAIIVGYFMSKLLLRRIFHLQTAMNDYRQKGVSFKVSHGGRDEIDDLSNSYNHLIEKLGEQENIRKEFFTDMSHELRTPLTSVKGYLEGLADGVFEPKKEVFDKALGETDRMIHLVKELTTLAKLEAGDIPLKLTEVDLRKLTGEVVEDFQARLAEKKTTVKITGDAKIKADHRKFRQVIVNLLDNALSHGDPGHEITITIGKESPGKDKSAHFWEIKNKAAGLSRKHLEYIFERFYRADKSRKYDEKEPHLGIGLNIVKKIVEAHKGKITAKTDDGYAVFRVEMPA